MLRAFRATTTVTTIQSRSQRKYHMINNRKGVVSNVFAHLLKRQIPLDELIRTAKLDSGLSYVELRQNGLGAPYESQDGFPNADALRELAVQFRDIHFNFALQLPYFSGTVNAANKIFLEGVRCARVLAEVSGQIPHLRLVDSTTSSQLIKECPKQSVIQNIEEMLQKLAEIGGILSLENSGQQGIWSEYWHIINHITQHRNSIKVCYDPCNLVKSECIRGDQLATHTPINTDNAPRPWKNEDIAIFHIKQSDGKQTLDVVCDGVVDWKKQVAQLKQIEYSGPICLEITPSENIFQNLKQSWTYLSPFM